MNAKILTTLLVGGIPFALLLFFSLKGVLHDESITGYGEFFGYIGLGICFILIWIIVFLCIFFAGVNVSTPIWMCLTFLSPFIILAVFLGGAILYLSVSSPW
jgi:hypothetical protein